MYGKETHNNAVYPARYASDGTHSREIWVHLGYGGGTAGFADGCKARATA